VAHELRTPIAELRTTVEVAMRWPEAEETPRVYADLLAIAERMQRLVSALLALRRAESGAETLALEAVVLRDAVDRAVARATARADGDRVGLGVRLSRAVARALGFDANAELGEGSELRMILRGPLHAPVATPNGGRRPITT